MNTPLKTVAQSYQGLFRLAHESLQGVMQDVDTQRGRWEPNDLIAPIEAQVVHVAVGEDVLVNGIVRGSTPLCATMFAERTGWQGQVPITDWNVWARTAQIDLPMVLHYARIVFGATEYWLGQIDDRALAQACDAALLGMGTLPAAAVLNLALSNVFLHTGEISCLKGLQGQRGYAATARPANTENLLSDEELATLFS